MSSKNFGRNPCGTSLYVQKIRRIKRSPPKYCPGCKETSDFVNLLCSKMNKIEEVMNNFEKFLEKTTPMEVDNPLEYALYCSSDWDPMDLD
jgi:hypothetical protein